MAPAPGVRHLAFTGTVLLVLGLLGHVQGGCMGGCSGSGSSMTSNGETYTCCSSKGQLCTSDSCPATCSTSAYTDVLDFRTASGTAYWQIASWNQYWTCADSWCQGKSFHSRPDGQESRLVAFANTDLSYYGQKYYMRATFTDEAGATAANALEIRLLTGSSNCASATNDASNSDIQALSMTKFYDNVCDNPGYRRPADVSYGTYEATYGPFYKVGWFRLPPREPRRKPGASSYTLTHPSLSDPRLIECCPRLLSALEAKI